MDAVIQEYRQLLSATADLAEKIASAETWREDLDSEAAKELEGATTEDGGQLTEDSIRTAYSVVQMGIHVCVQHVRAASEILNLQISPLSVEVLARAAVEMAATSWWIAEQGIGARRRVCRLQLLRINSAMELKRLTDEIGDANTDRRFGENEEDVIAYSASLGLEPFTNGSRRRFARCELDLLPTYTARAKSLLTFYGASHAYMMFSGSAHGEIWSIWRHFQDETDSPDIENPLRRLVPNRTAIRGATNILLLSLVSQIDATGRLFGWTGDSPQGSLWWPHRATIPRVMKWESFRPEESA
jgi:hypothetical protein